MPESPDIGVVLTDLGGPSDPDEVRPFLISLLSDPAVLRLPAIPRTILARLIARRRQATALERYRLIGGESPVHREVAAQASALQHRLGPGFRVRHAFRHSAPRAGEVLGELAREGTTRVVAVPLFPQRSFTTWDSCVNDLARQARGLGLAWSATSSFPEGEGYHRALRHGVEPLLERAEHLLLVAHGLPVSHIRRGDPYLDEVWRTARKLGAWLPRDRSWTLAFQSRLGPVRWIGPYLEDEIGRLARRGVRSLAVVPLSFTCENLETLYDLDREAADLARDRGIATYLRAPAPGSHPGLIDQLAELIEGAAGGQRPAGGAGR